MTWHGMLSAEGVRCRTHWHGMRTRWLKAGLTIDVRTALAVIAANLGAAAAAARAKRLWLLLLLRPLPVCNAQRTRLRQLPQLHVVR